MNIVREISLFLGRRLVIFGVLFFPIPLLFLVYWEGPKVLGNLYYMFGGRSPTFDEAMKDLLFCVAIGGYVIWVVVFLVFIGAKFLQRMRERQGPSGMALS